MMVVVVVGSDESSESGKDGGTSEKHETKLEQENRRNPTTSHAKSILPNLYIHLSINISDTSRHWNF